MSTIPKTIAFHTLGCKTNYSETSSISREIIKSGFEKVGYNELADIYVLNTCSVTENANKDARKFVRKAKRNNPNATIVVIGCYAQLKPDEIGEIDGVDIVLGAKEKFNLIVIENFSLLFHNIFDTNQKHLKISTENFTLIF